MPDIIREKWRLQQVVQVERKRGESRFYVTIWCTRREDINLEISTFQF